MLVLASCLICLESIGFALENTSMLPKGVRNIQYSQFFSVIRETTDHTSFKNSLASQLERKITFNEVLATRSGVEAQALGEFINSTGFNITDSLGQFEADMAVKLQVFVPRINYGITDRLSFGFALPIYSAENKVNIGFQPNNNSRQFIAALSQPAINQRGGAIQLTNQLDQAVVGLNTKLTAAGYQPLSDWSDQGLGDAVLGLKWLAHQNSTTHDSVLSVGIVIPFGRVDNPKIVNDMPFGDGQFDFFGQVTSGFHLIPQRLTVNSFAKYTQQLEGRKQVRLATESDSVFVPIDRVDFKLGNKWDLGSSIHLNTPFGLFTTLGYQFIYKYQDRYKSSSKSANQALASDTLQSEQFFEGMIGFSSIEAYRKKKFIAPFTISLGYKHILKSRNLPIANLVQLESSIFF